MEWNTLRHRIMEDDDFHCSICKKDFIENKGKLCIHHKNKDRSDNRLENLILCCNVCHGKLHNPKKVKKVKITKKWSVNRKQYKCSYCGWIWFSRPNMLKNKIPKVCPHCHNDWRKRK